MATRRPLAVPPAESSPTALILDPALARELAVALGSIRYGTIELVIHEGRVVQLERREKVRFEHEQRRER